MPRRTHRADRNQASIVKALRAIPGVKVVLLGRPVDIAVGHKGKTYFFDLKSPDKPSPIRPTQAEFIESWTGGYAGIAHTFDEIWETIK